MELVKLIKLQWDRSLALTLGFVGGVMLFIGWFRISDSPVVTEQVPYVMSAGLGGLFLLGLGSILWVSADSHDEWRALEDFAKHGTPPGGDGETPPGHAAAGLGITKLLERRHDLETRLAAAETKAPASRARSRQLRAPELSAVATTLAD